MGQRLLVANAGDSRCVLARGGKGEGRRTARCDHVAGSGQWAAGSWQLASPHPSSSLCLFADFAHVTYFLHRSRPAPQPSPCLWTTSPTCVRSARASRARAASWCGPAPGASAACSRVCTVRGVCALHICAAVCAALCLHRHLQLPAQQRPSHIACKHPAVSRAIGDRCLKRFVVATPDVREEDLTAKGRFGTPLAFYCMS